MTYKERQYGLISFSALIVVVVLRQTNGEVGDHTRDSIPGFLNHDTNYTPE